MAKVKKVAIFSHAHPNGVNWVLGLRDGFESHGMEVLTSWPHPKGEILNAINVNFKPDLIVEINRSKDQIEDYNDIGIPHVTIQQDFRGHGSVFTNTTMESELYYAIFQPSHFDFPEEMDARTKPFFPGANPLALKYSYKKDKPFELGLAGFIESINTFSKSVVSQPALPEYPEYGKIMDAARALKIDHTTINKSTYVRDIRRDLADYFRQKGLQDFSYQKVTADEGLTFFFTMSFVRFLNRRFIAQSMIKASKKTAFWGPAQWLTWPNFAPYHQGELFSVHELFGSYVDTAITLHSTGTNLHIRVSDGMSLGAAIAIIDNTNDEGPFGMRQYFEPDVDFIQINHDNMVDKLKFYLKKPDTLQKIGQSAREKIFKNLTWKHQCGMILRDLKALG